MNEKLRYGLRHDYTLMISHMEAPEVVTFNVPSGATYYIVKLKCQHKKYKYIFKVMYDDKIDFITCRYTLKDIVDQMILYESLLF